MSKGAPDYTKITLLKGAAPDGSLVTLAVDTSGNILAVLKGEYGGVLKTVQTDVNGLLLAKIYDPDDIFGVSGTIGLGELAARLGSLMVYDRRGQYIWGDDFEGTALKWQILQSGTGASVALDTTNVYSKNQGVKLTCGSTSFKSAGITKWLSLQSSGRIGYEVTISLPITLFPSYILFTIYYYTGSQQEVAQVKWDTENGKIYILNSGGTYTEVVSSWKKSGYQQAWHKLKFVADTITQKYVRLLYGNAYVDLSAYDLRVAANSGTPTTILDVNAYGHADVNDVAWIDDVIITMKEP